MSLRPTKDKGPEWPPKRTISAESIRDALGIKPKPKEVPRPDSPAQARLRLEGRDKEADALASDDFSYGELSEAEAYEAVGRPPLGAPPGSPDGTPLPIAPAPSDAARQARGRAGSDAEPTTPAADGGLSREARQLRRETRAHLQGVIARGVEAQASGDPKRIARMEREAKESLSLGRRVAQKLGLERL